MSVQSELLMNTQNSFQTHAQRGANIVMRGGKRKSRRKKGGGSGFGTDVYQIMGCNKVSGAFGDCGRARDLAVNDQDDYGKKWIEYNLNWINSAKSEEEKFKGLNRLNVFIVNMNKSPLFKNVIFPQEFNKINEKFKGHKLPILERVGDKKSQ